jgi:hypothetical protein
VIRRFNGSSPVGEYHLPEHLENDWRPDGHPGDRPLIRSLDYIGRSDAARFQQGYARRLREYFEKELAKPAAAAAVESPRREFLHHPR